ncbi:hypothetical protein FACS189418_9160 [Clostridia bacterium]|nr:hypothetical protein FACS189418_9160 [Clostridia bacterium]
MNQLGIDQKKEEGIKSIVDQVWNTPFVSVGNAQTKVKSPKKMRSIFGNINNPSYYQFTVTEWNTWNLLFFSVKTSPKQIEVTGWNTKRIKPLTMMNTAFQSVMNLEYYQKNLDKLDHKLIIEQAFLKALKEVCQKHLPSFLQPTESDEAKQV